MYERLKIFLCLSLMFPYHKCVTKHHPVYEDKCFTITCILEPYINFYYTAEFPISNKTKQTNGPFHLQKNYLGNHKNGTKWINGTNCVTKKVNNSKLQTRCLLFTHDDIYSDFFKIRLINNNNVQVCAIKMKKFSPFQNVSRCYPDPGPKNITIKTSERKIKIEGIIDTLLATAITEATANIKYSEHGKVLQQMNIEYNRCSETPPCSISFKGLAECTSYNVTINMLIKINDVNHHTKPYTTSIIAKTKCKNKQQEKDKKTHFINIIVILCLGLLLLFAVGYLIFRYVKKTIKVKKDNILTPRDNTDLIVPIGPEEEDEISETKNEDGSHGYDVIVK